MPFLGATARPGRMELANLAAPPRDIPLGLRARLWAGGPMGAFGWVFLGFGLIFVWMFVGAADLAGMFQFNEPLATATGEVTECERTNASEGRRPGTRIFANHFRFDSGARTGTSYASGTCLAVGTPVPVEYPIGRPDLARIQGMRRAEFKPWVLVVVVFPLIGLAFVLYFVRQGRRHARLLERGRLGWAKLLRREKTNIRVNKRPVWKLYFALETGFGGTHEISARTSFPDRLTDEAREPALFDPDAPGDAVLWDLLPGAPRVSGGGQLRGPNPVGTFFLLLPAAATLVGHSYWLWTKLR